MGCYIIMKSFDRNLKKRYNFFDTFKQWIKKGD